MANLNRLDTKDGLLSGNVSENTRKDNNSDQRNNLRDNNNALELDLSMTNYANDENNNSLALRNNGTNSATLKDDVNIGHNNAVIAPVAISNVNPLNDMIGVEQSLDTNVSLTNNKTLLLPHVNNLQSQSTEKGKNEHSGKTQKFISMLQTGLKSSDDLNGISRSIPNSPLTFNMNNNNNVVNNNQKLQHDIISINSMPNLVDAATFAMNNNINLNKMDLSKMNLSNNLNLHSINRKRNNITPALSISSSTTESPSNQLRLFQRLEELSARMIKMEEEFQNLTAKVEQQSVTLHSIKNNIPNIVQNSINEQFKEFQKQNEIFLKSQFQQHSINNSSQENNLATQLLNSIANISATYLNNQNSNRNNNTLSNNSNNNYNNGIPHSPGTQHYSNTKPKLSTTVPTISNNPATYQIPSFTNGNNTFTLNPNGMKKRKRNNSHDHSSHKSSRTHPSQHNRNTPDLIDMPITLPSDPFTSFGSMNNSNNVNNNSTSTNNNSTNNVTTNNTGLTNNNCTGNANANNSNAAGTNSINVPLTISQTQPTQGIPIVKNASTQPPLTAISLPIPIQVPVSAGHTTHNEPTKSTTNSSKHKHGADEDDVEDGYQEDDEEDDDHRLNSGTNVTAKNGKPGGVRRRRSGEGIEEDDDDDYDDNEEYEEEEEDEIPTASHGETGMSIGQTGSDDNADDEEDDIDDINFEEDEVDEDIANSNGKHSKNSVSKKKIVKKPGMKKKIIKKTNLRPMGENETEKSSTTIIDGNKERDMNDEINYTLIKAPNNVRTIWEEYVYGINSNPSIRGLEEKYGNKWRLTKNRKTFSRRKRLYKFILNGIDKGKTADEMIKTLEERRLYKDENGEVKRRTIGWLQQSLTGI